MMRTGGLTCVDEQWKGNYIYLCSMVLDTVPPQCWESDRIRMLSDSTLLSYSSFFSTMCLYTGSLLSSPPAPGCLQHRMSSCQRQSKSDKHTGWTSEENLAPCSSAISARESSYKKHLLHFVLSMMLWKINTGMVCLPLLSLSLCESLCPFLFM